MARTGAGGGLPTVRGIVRDPNRMRPERAKTAVPAAPADERDGRRRAGETAALPRPLRLRLRFRARSEAAAETVVLVFENEILFRHAGHERHGAANVPAPFTMISTRTVDVSVENFFFVLLQDDSFPKISTSRLNQFNIFYIVVFHFDA